MKTLLKKRGFTLVEMLVVIAIIGILVAMLLPVINQAREAALKNTCSANIGQLVKAQLLHHDSFKKFAPAAYDANGTPAVVTTNTVPGSTGVSATSAPFSWFVRLLPYMEEKEAFDAIDFSKGPFDTENQRVTYRVIKLAACPSFSGENRTVNSTDYTAATSGPETGSLPGICNYAAMGGTTIDALYAGDDPDGGIPHGLTTRVASMADGSSKTIVFTETKEEEYSAWADGSVMTICGLHPNLGGSDPAIAADGQTLGASPYLSAVNQNFDKSVTPPTEVFFMTKSTHFGGTSDRKWGPSSDHSGLALHGFGDGSVHSINDDIEPEVYHSLITRRGRDSSFSSKLFE